jgi:hypothetical protein
VKLKPVEIRVDGGTQPRAELLFEVMEEYAEDMRNGVKFPPITVFFDGKDYWLADGFHRVGAHLRAFGEDAPIEVEVIEGTQSDAQWYSYGVNKAHGVRRTNPDKERAVRAALQHAKGAGLSNCQIAEHCGVSEFMVRKHRKASTSIKSKSTGPEMATSIESKSDGDGAATSIKSKSTNPGERPPAPNRDHLRTGRDGRTINTANIGKGSHRKAQKPRSPAEFMEARRNGYRGRLSSMVKLELPNNHVYNCAYDLLRHFTFEYLQKVFQEVINIHQEGLEKENPE